jgi:hypothetical protein
MYKLNAKQAYSISIPEFYYVLVKYCPGCPLGAAIW